MIEIWLFGRLLVTLPSALSVVLVIVALTSVTYLATILTPALNTVAGLRWRGRARVLGLSTATVTLAAALLELRVGGAGGGGELVPSLAVSLAAAAASGAAVAFVALGAGASAALLAAARERRRVAVLAALATDKRRLQVSRRAHLEGDDVRNEVADATAALARLQAALDKLAGTQVALEARLGALDDAAAAGELGRELRRTRDEVATKLDLGTRILGAAGAATFRLACSAPLRRLLRRRPRDLTRGVGDGAPALAAAVAVLEGFLGEADLVRGELAALEGKRPPPSEHEGAGDDPWAQAKRDLAAIEDAYGAVRDRLGALVMRGAARADMEAVASAAGEVSAKARASGIPASDLQELVSEVTRAESAILLATPGELDGRSLSEALARSIAALGEGDGASLDELLEALREVG